VSALAAPALGVASLAFLAGLAALALLRRRIERVELAEHELRGAATALALTGARVRRLAGGARVADALDAQLDRLRAGLDDLTRLRGAMPPEPLATLDVTAMTRAALAPWEAGVPAGGFAWLGPPANARVDRGSFAKTLGNLLANAAEHGDGELRVRGRSTAASVRIEIRNRNRARARSPAAGRGRGLGIAERAAREMGGRLLVEVGEEETVAVLELPRLQSGGDEDVAA